MRIVHADARYAAGVFTLTAICGLIDATCFLALGGVFAELMTGNLLLLGVTAGAQLADPVRLLAYVGALVPFCIGAFVTGRLTNSRHPAAGRVVGYPLEYAFILLATVLAVWLTPAASGPLAERAVLVDENPALEDTRIWVRMTIVALLAFAMGVHNAMMRRHGVPDIATNVLTLTLTGLISESRPAGGTARAWKRQLGSILIFLVAAAVGAWLLRFHVSAPLVLATVLFTLALRPLMRARMTMPGQGAAQSPPAAPAPADGS